MEEQILVLLNKIIKKQDQMEESQKILQQDMQSMKQDMDNMKQDMDNMKQDMKNMKQDMKNMKQDMKQELSQELTQESKRLISESNQELKRLISESNQELKKFVQDEIEKVNNKLLLFEHKYGREIDAIYDAVVLEREKNIEKSEKIKKLDARVDKVEGDVFCLNKRVFDLEKNCL